MIIVIQPISFYDIQIDYLDNFINIQHLKAMVK